MFNATDSALPTDSANTTNTTNETNRPTTTVPMQRQRMPLPHAVRLALADRALTGWLLAFSLLGALDVALTLIALAHGAVEANPLYALLLPCGIPLAIGLHTLINVVIVTNCVVAYEAVRLRPIVRWQAIIFTLAQLAIVLSNIWQLFTMIAR